MARISIPQLNPESAAVALSKILKKVDVESDTVIGKVVVIARGGIDTKDKTALRAIGDTDFDKLAVLAGILMAIGEENLEKVQGFNEEKCKKLLDSARKSDAFRYLLPSERRVINSAYRALAFKGGGLGSSWDTFLDILSQIWVDVKSSKMPPLRIPQISHDERQRIEEVLSKNITLKDIEDRDEPRSLLEGVLDIVGRGDEEPFHIKNPSKALCDFAKHVRDFAKRFLEEIPPMTLEEREFTDWFNRNVPQKMIRLKAHLEPGEISKAKKAMLRSYLAYKERQSLVGIPGEQVQAEFNKYFIEINAIIEQENEGSALYNYALSFRDDMLGPKLIPGRSSWSLGPDDESSVGVPEGSFTEGEEFAPEAETQEVASLLQWAQSTYPDDWEKIMKSELETIQGDDEVKDLANEYVQKILKSLQEGKKTESSRLVAEAQRQNPGNRSWQSFATKCREFLTEVLKK